MASCELGSLLGAQPSTLPESCRGPLASVVAPSSREDGRGVASGKFLS